MLHLTVDSGISLRRGYGDDQRRFGKGFGDGYGDGYGDGFGDPFRRHREYAVDSDGWGDGDGLGNGDIYGCYVPWGEVERPGDGQGLGF